jgi:hypothetical protein
MVWPSTVLDIPEALLPYAFRRRVWAPEPQTEFRFHARAVPLPPRTEN